MNERELLARLIEGPVNGDALARMAGQTRAAVWKRIDSLREAGVPITARPGRGYALARPLELLDEAGIRRALPPGAEAQLAALDVAWTLDSTNSELLRRPAPAGGAEVLLAERQTGGRGRRGREWASPLAANIYMSLSRMFSGGLARLPGLSLVAGVATAEALAALGYARVALKWPNDLVVERDGSLRKLGGLLVEGGGENAGPVRAVIGLGLNVRMPDSQSARIGQPYIDLSTLAGGMHADRTHAGGMQEGGMTSRNQVVAAVLAHWLPALDAFDAQGLAPFLPRYRAFDALAGRAVTLHTHDGAQPARALGLAADGALRVDIDGVEQRVHSGEVSVRPA